VLLEKEKAVGMHFFNPVAVMKLAGRKSIFTPMKPCLRFRPCPAGKEPVVCKDLATDSGEPGLWQ
jgi:hypothetical protein